MVNIDRHIALSAGWVAGPAFGVAMMAAPEYFHLGPIASGLLFWGGIGVFLATIAVVAIVSAHEEKRRKRVLGPIVMMAFGALILCGGAAWYYWPNKEQPQKTVESSASVPSQAVPSGPLAALTNAQLRERVIAFAQSLRNLEAEYESRRQQMDYESFVRTHNLQTDAEKLAEWNSANERRMALDDQKQAEFMNKYRADAIILREELQRRLGTLPMPQQRGGPADTQIFDKPFLAGPAPLSNGADLLEYWAKQLP